MSSEFLKRLEKSVILGDGAMGTQLYERGVYINRNYDDLNLTDAHVVKAVHRDYIKAGAEMIETNTFGANPFRLGKHGLADKTFEINKAGADLARRCAEEGAGVLVAGSIGPLGKPIAPVGRIGIKEAHDGFRGQVEGLLAGGVDLFNLETFLDIREIQIAIGVVRELSDLPIVASMTINESGLTAYGRSPEEIAEVLDREPVEVIGLNCSTGPQNILEGIVRIRAHTGKHLAAFPNAGEPRIVEGRIIYMSTPEYFAEYSKRLMQNGVNLIGGCCGTTPAHIRFMKTAIRALHPVLEEVEIAVPKEKLTRKKLPEVVLPPRGERSRLGKLLDRKAFPVSCELHPPKSPSVGRILEQVRMLQIAGINVVNIPDGPRASARMSPMALAHIIQRETGMDTILHYTCRDRNILGMQSDLLGAEVLCLANILCVTGDPPKLGDYPMASAVFDVDAIGLLRIASNLNHSRDLAGNPIPKQTGFFLGAAFNPGAIDLELEINRLHKKIDAGAEYIMTQPVFEQEVLLESLEKVGDLKVPVFCGILPLASYRNAQFFHHEVPGMDVPEPILERMKTASEKGKEAGEAEGVTIAREALSSVRKYVQGAYIMPPFGRIERAIDTAGILKGHKTLDEVKKKLDRTEKRKK